MKTKKIVGLFFALSVIVAIINACGSNNNPAAPSAPAATATPVPPCQNLSPTPSPCTPTDTPTATNSPTDSPSNTPSPTATVTPTKTPSNTATNSPTVTETMTPSNTATVTPTNSPTNSPTNTTSPLPTNTPTNSPTNSPTATPTNTVLNTPTLCYTQVPTPTISTAQGFRINVTYSPGGVSAAHPIRFYIWGSGGPNSGNGDNRLITSSGPLTYYSQTAGTGGFAAWYDTAGNGGNQPEPSDYGVIYNNGGCNLGAWTTITVPSGAITNLGTLTFGATNLFYGFSGSVTYQGSAGGNVDACTPIVTGIYSDPGYTTLVGGNTQSTYSNGGPYDNFDAANLCNTNNYYVQAWYAKSGNTNSPQLGDPITQLGLRTTASTANLSITIN